MNTQHSHIPRGGCAGLDVRLCLTLHSFLLLPASLVMAGQRTRQQVNCGDERQKEHSGENKKTSQKIAQKGDFGNRRKTKIILRKSHENKDMNRWIKGRKPSNKNIVRKA